MRIIITIFCACLVVSLPARAQEKDKWKRVYTYEDAKVEMNESKVAFGEEESARVQFRWTLKQPANVTGKPGMKYQSRVEVIEFACLERRYRLVEVTLFDAKGNLILTDNIEDSAEWKYLKTGSVMARLFAPACDLIERKRSKT
jgi:hypothetical protein